MLSLEYTYEQYPSAMNYAAPIQHRDYSDGTNSPVDFEDWDHIDTEDGGGMYRTARIGKHHDDEPVQTTCRGHQRY